MIPGRADKLEHVMETALGNFITDETLDRILGILEERVGPGDAR
jgi:hypothetical protein